MRARQLVFLDANMIFSAALGGPAFQLLLRLARSGAVDLVTAESCLIEAEVNLERKRPDRQDELLRVAAELAVGAEVEDDQHSAWARDLIHADGVHVLAAARRAGADVLLTGDTTHFGPLMERDDLGLRIRTLRAFLLEGPVRTARGHVAG